MAARSKHSLGSSSGPNGLPIEFDAKLIAEINTEAQLNGSCTPNGAAKDGYIPVSVLYEATNGQVRFSSFKERLRKLSIDGVFERVKVKDPAQRVSEYWYRKTK